METSNDGHRNKRKSKTSSKKSLITHTLVGLIFFHLRGLLEVSVEDNLAPHPYPPSLRANLEEFALGNQRKWWRGKANLINLTHPHYGARDIDGSLQMILNPSPERLTYNNRPHQDIICPKNGEEGIERAGGNQVLQKAKRGINKYYQSKKKYRGSKILCMVYTVHLPGDEHTNLKAISQTWARNCDGFFAASNMTDHSVGAIDLPHLGPEGYGNMWQKVRTMWSYAYDHYKDDYDFFHIVGDDTYVIVENLRNFVDGSHVHQLEQGKMDKVSRYAGYKEKAKKWINIRPRPLWFGMIAFRSTNPMSIFPAGGPGYTLNRAALDFWGKHAMHSFCPGNIDAREDVFMGGFFGEQHGIYLSHDLDENFARRYVESADEMFHYANSQPKPFLPKVLKDLFYLESKEYINSTSEEVFSFHLKDDREFLKRKGRTIAELIHRYHAVLYDKCD